MAIPPPELNIPTSSATVDVSIINTRGSIRGVNVWRFMEPAIKGFDFLPTPMFSFYIHHPVLNRSLVFDLGLKHEIEDLPPPLLERLRNNGYTLDAPTHVRKILDEGGVDTASIEAVVWSHWHFDHTGNPSTFEPGTKLIVGPGCKEHIFPGYPENPTAAFLQKDVEGREVQELDFARSPPLKLGRFDAIDYFGDGSFYLVDAPGHAVGHVCGVARVTTGPPRDSFVVMGGDAFHHGGELRPHPWRPLPGAIAPHPFSRAAQVVCPGELFAGLLPGGDREQPFMRPTKPPRGPSVHHHVPEAIESIRKLQEYDAHENMLVVAAHDASLLHVVDFFPKLANDFAKKGWVEQARWAFLQDFAEAVGYDGEVVGKADYSPNVQPIVSGVDEGETHVEPRQVS